jgi:galactokinase
MAFLAIDAALSAGKATGDAEHGDGGYHRWQALDGRFRERFGRAAEGVARAPGRVNLIGEHIDYEGYAVLPMAIEQAVCAAFAASKGSGDAGDGHVRLRVQLASVDEAEYPPDELVMTMGAGDAAPALRSGRQAWANYVACGLLVARSVLAQALSALDQSTQAVEVKLCLMIDGGVPPACGLSSSSALVVASAIAATYAIANCCVTGFVMPSRVEMAELCRRAEGHVGTMGGGMDQAISCLGQRGHALYISFRPELSAQPVKLHGMDATVGAGEDLGGYAFVVANSGVVAQKAVDATTRFNKRVVECALAAKLIGKKMGLDEWQQVRATWC